MSDDELPPDASDDTITQTDNDDSTNVSISDSFREKFLPPMPEPLYDENGNQIGVKEPDQVIFDPNGNPIGKKMGDMVATDVEGNRGCGEARPSVSDDV
mgnify:CR=1 FL=1